MITMTEALARLVNCKQADNEQLLDYIKRFKQLRDVVKNYLGTEVLNKFAEYQDDYKKLGDDDDKQKKYKDEFF